MFTNFQKVMGASVICGGIFGYGVGSLITAGANKMRGWERTVFEVKLRGEDFLSDKVVELVTPFFVGFGVCTGLAFAVMVAMPKEFFGRFPLFQTWV